MALTDIGIPIQSTECIGDSLAKINAAFLSLETVALNKVDRPGDTMQGNLDFDGNKILRFTAQVTQFTDSFLIDPSLNGSVILVASNSTDAVSATMSTLCNTGFNAIIIQMGSAPVTIVPMTNGTIASSNNFTTTKIQYAPMNICVVAPGVTWVSGDLKIGT
jgi:hypothetical protein